MACIPDASALRAVCDALPDQSYEVLGFAHPGEARGAIDQLEVEVVIAATSLHDRTGAEWLAEVRRADPETKLALLMSTTDPMGVVLESVNTVGVVKLLVQPVDPDLLRFEIDEAIQRFGDEVHRARKLALSSVKVRRLTRSYEQACRDLARNRRELRALSRHPATPRPPATTPTTPLELSHTHVGPGSSTDELLGGVDLPALLSRGMLELLADAMEHDLPRGSVERTRRLAERCANDLAWSDEEVREIRIAAAIHHALLGRHPREATMLSGRARHASSLADRLVDVPGLESIAAMVRHHHHPWEARASLDEIPRGTWLLQLVSTYERFYADPELSRLEADDPHVRLTMAAARCLELAGTYLHPDLTRRVVTEFIPRLLKREERCLPLDQLEAGMVLSRAIYADHVPFITAGVTVETRHIERIRATAENLDCAHAWISGDVPSPARAAPSSRKHRRRRSASSVSERAMLTPTELP